MRNITTIIYGGGPFYYGGNPVFSDLKSSGFTTVNMGIHLGPSGDIQIDIPLVQDSQYVGNPDWPAELASLKEGTTGVNRLLFCIGGWGTGDFRHIKDLVESEGTGPDSILYRNFQALKKAIPTLDGIDLDDESIYDQASTVAFCKMLGELGYQVTFCPYTMQDYWMACLQQLESQAPGLVTGFNLQCYAGGAGNTPEDWINAIANAMGPDFPAASLVFPGLWCRNGDGCDDGSCPSDIAAQFAGWQASGIQGGFIWLYDDIQKCANSSACGAGVPMGSAAYANAIVQGLQQSTPAPGAVQPVG